MNTSVKKEYFNKIRFDELPDSFVLKCNHGCKWQYIIKNKNEYLINNRLIDITRRQIEGWLNQKYCYFHNFEMNYRDIKPKILIEPLLRENINKEVRKIQVFCFKGKVKYVVRMEEGDNNKTTLFDENLNIIDDVLSRGDINMNIKADDLIKQSYVLSEKLAENTNFVRVDWMIFNNKIFFEEMTFYPYSGFHKYNKKFYKLMSKLINLEKMQ